VTVADTLISSVNAVSHDGVAKADMRGRPLAGAAHITSQGYASV